jgi:cysteine desulfurase
VTYLDAAVVAPVNPVARQAVLAGLEDGWADPRRMHAPGRQARLELESAREALAAELGARTEEVILTGSYEAAVHAAILGVRQARRRAGSVVVTSAIEHSAILHAAAWSDGIPLRIGVDHDGRVDPVAFAQATASPGVVLACLQAANSEVGTCQPVQEVAAAAHRSGVPLLMDATSVAGNAVLPGDWDLLVADPRSWGAPGGLGVLVVRAGTRWTSPGPAGEGTEKLAGTPSVPLALAAAVALQQANGIRAEQDAHRRGLLRLIRDCAAGIPDTQLAGPGAASRGDSLPHVLTFSSLFVDGEAVVGELDRLGFAVGSGSACTSSTLQPSHVLEAMGVLTHGNVRIGLPPGISAQEVERFCGVLPGAIASVRSMLGADDL